ncbi:DUF6083 domain-containing protein [Streptomyces sp. NPDC086787]|uniref:DUF6083 domain-containing protein n=1 Tax=Streptomyces sp. NPDC086787 TaxID=3365759 RepID=UPI0038077237
MGWGLRHALGHVLAALPNSLVAGCTCRADFCSASRRTPQDSRPVCPLRMGGQGADSRCMGASEGSTRRLGGARLMCPHCGLPQERVATLEHDWVLLEPDMAPLAHVVPAEYRWIETSDGCVTVYGVCPPDPFQRCRIEHRLACPGQSLPDLWPWLTSLRGENERHAERLNEPEPPLPPEAWPDAG